MPSIRPGWLHAHPQASPFEGGNNPVWYQTCRPGRASVLCPPASIHHV